VQALLLEDLLLLAEDVLHQPAEKILRIIDIGAAESALAAPFAGFGDRAFYEGVALRAAILASPTNPVSPLGWSRSSIDETRVFSGLEHLRDRRY
jgi:hypothetical protein